MPLIQKNDVNQIFAEQAPSIDKPATFANYPRGWDESRKNNGKPLIKQFNHLQQRTDQNILWIHQNGAALPYDANIEYADNAIVLKDGELQQLKEGQWKPTKDSDVIKTVESIADLIAIKNPKDGQVVYVKNNEENYSSFYIYKPLEGGWVVKESKTDAIANIFTKRCNGFISLFEFIPERYLEDIKALQTSGEKVGDVSSYVQEALDFASVNKMDVLAPFGYYFVSKPIDIPSDIRFIGLSLPYFLTTGNFVGDTVFNVDHAYQDQYHIENFRFSGNGNKNYSAVHVGGCRNSVFKNLTGTSFKAGVVRVHATHPDSGDVENIELDHIWAVRSAGLVFKTNSDISRGNITDGTITNCQLTSGDAENDDGYALELTASAGKLIFGLKFDRIFTKATDNNHIIINPNGGAIYGNAFKNFTGESWSIANPFEYITQHCLYVFDGAFFSNIFESFYKTGMQGNGIRLGIGSIGNLFNDLMFQDRLPLYNFRNEFINFPSGAKDNVFTNVYVRDAIYGANTSAASTLFGRVYGRIVGGGVADNSVTGSQITNVAPVLIKKSQLFEINGLQLKNYPVEGCAFQAHPEGVVMTIPANSTEYVLSVPFTPTTKVNRISSLFHYVFDSERSGMEISVNLCGLDVSSSGYERYADRYVSFIADYDEQISTLNIKFGGTRTAEVRILIKDIVICQGGAIPYAYNYQKNYIES